MDSKARGPATAGGCGPCSPTRRNRYFSGKPMRIADYELEQAYHIGRRRLVNRAMLGWGVVEGFKIRDLAHGVAVGAGVALDPWGRELVACGTTRLCDPDDVVWLTPSGDDSCKFKAGDPPQPSVPAKDPKCDDPAQAAGGSKEPAKRLWLLAAHYAERRLDGVVIDDGCVTRCEPNNLCETVVYSLRPIECCEAGLPDCRCPRCAGEDRGACEKPTPPGTWDPLSPVKDRPLGADDEEQKREESATDGDQGAAGEHAGEDEELADGRNRHGRCFSLDRGNHRQLVLWSLDRRGCVDPCGEARLAAKGCIALDPCAGVPLACVTIGFHCGEPFIDAVIDAAHPRRLARRNEDLFDLVRGCDLTRIADVGWRDWLAVGSGRVAFKDFAAMFDPPVYGLNQRRVPVKTRLTVGFTAPVRADCLTTDALTITLVSRESREAVGDMVRVPVVRLAPDPGGLLDPAGTTRGFAVEVASSFWEGELDRRTSSTFERPTIVEIEIRTDFIDDCNGQQVAGGGRSVPSSGCVPGGRFLSSFIVIPDRARDADDPDDADEVAQQEALK